MYAGYSARNRKRTNYPVRETKNGGQDLQLKHFIFKVKTHTIHDRVAVSPTKLISKSTHFHWEHIMNNQRHRIYFHGYKQKQEFAYNGG